MTWEAEARTVEPRARRDDNRTENVLIRPGAIVEYMYRKEAAGTAMLPSFRRALLKQARHLSQPKGNHEYRRNDCNRHDI